MNTLVQLLIDSEILLRSVGEIFWADKIQTTLRRNRSNVDLYMLEEIQSWYGGMGSFNDLMLSKYNDHLINVQDEQKLNDQLSRLRSEIYQEVMRLKRN